MLSWEGLPGSWQASGWSLLQAVARNLILPFSAEFCDDSLVSPFNHIAICFHNMLYTESDVIVDYPTREDVYALNSAEKIGL